MFKKIKGLAGDSLIYGLSGVLTRFISVFLIPIYTRIFAPSDYGVINLVNSTFLLIGILVVVGLDNAAATWYWQKEDDAERASTFSSWFWMQFSLSVLVLLAVLAVSSFLSKAILDDARFYDLFILSALSLPFTAFTLAYTTWLRVKRKPLATVAFSLTKSLLSIGFSVYFVVYLRIGLVGVFLALLIANILSAMVALYVMRKVFDFRHFALDRAKEMLRFSIPLIPATICFWLLNSAGGYFISQYASKADVGLYQIGSSIAAVCNIVFWAFLQAWSPFAMSIHKQQDAPNIYAMVFDLYCALGGAIVLFIFLFSPEILMLLTTEAYYNAALVAGILSVNIFIFNISQVTSIGCAIVRTNMPYAVGVAIASIFTVGLYFVLIPVLGKEGAAISTLIGSLILSGYVTYKAQLLYFIPYRLKKNAFLILLMMLLALTSIVWPGSGILSNIMYKAILLSLFLAFVFYVNKDTVLKLVEKLKKSNALS